MTAATMSGAIARSSFVRIRALPEIAVRRNEPKPVAFTATPQATASATAGSIAVSRAVANHTAGTRQSSKPKKHEAIEFRLIFAAAFAVFLLASIVERALPHKWAQRAGSGEVSKSVFEQAREAAHISVAYAFMG